MPLEIYNTLSQKKEPFVPLEPGKVKIYVCGPTVYNFLHVGNFRGPVFFNLVRNWLERSGFSVSFALNFTDVDDRIIDRAAKEGVSSSEVSERYIDEYQQDIATLGLRAHDHNPKVTQYMNEIIAMIEDLINNGKAYVKDGEVLYSVRSFEGYGKLSHRSLDDLQSGTRIEVDQKKRDPMDFSLWKPAKPGEPKWGAPWSAGRPGWHIECSAMIRAIFGSSIDIHGGGLDLVFPHHENEIAQSEGATGKPFVKYWMHWNMLNLGTQKMSKSVGNIVTAREFLKQYNSEIYKFMILQAHYRSVTEFSDKQVHNVISGLARIYSALALADSLLAAADLPERYKSDGFTVAQALELPMPAALKEALKSSEKAIEVALNDDFNTPEAFAAIFNVVRAFNAVCRFGQKMNETTAAAARAFRTFVIDKGQLMSLFERPAAGFLRELDDMLLAQMNVRREEVDRLVAERSAVRAAKDFKKSDELRDQLLAMGIALMDSPQGTHWEVQK